MRFPLHGVRIVALAAVAAISAGHAYAAAKPTDFVHPHFADYHVKTIALLPTVVLSGANGASETMGQALERDLAPLAYRWVSVPGLRAALVDAKQAGAIDAINEKVRKATPPDSAALAAVGQTGVADAVLASIVSTWERETIDVTQAGSSMTQIALTAYLYSTRTGELLWSRKFQVKGEGPYNNPDGSEVVGLKSGTLDNDQPRTSTSLDPPTYEEEAAKLAGQIKDALPPPPKPSAP